MHKKNALDYFSFGMPMPNRRFGVNGYRYSFQGQEKDPETGKEAFQLRLWDGRIGRWLTTDPYSQYASPYVGMGNDPINGIDPDGGYKTKWGRFWGWVGGGFKGSFTSSDNPGTEWHKYGIVKETSDGLSFDFGLNNGGHKELMDYGYQNNGTNYFNSGSGFMRASKYDWTDKWKDGSKGTYGFANDFYVVGQNFNPFDKQLTNIDGSGVVRGSSENLDMGVSVLSTFIPFGRGAAVGGKTLKGAFQVNKFNASKFSSTFKGNLAKLSPKLRGFLNKQILNKTINYYNTQVGGGMLLFTASKKIFGNNRE